MPHNNALKSSAFIGAIVLGSVSIALFLIILAALVGYQGFWVFPGQFLADIYGPSAFVIPLYLFIAAVALGLPGYNPFRFFVLAASILPFFTLAAGTAIAVQPDRLFPYFSIPGFLSPTAVVVFTIVVAALESYAITALGIFFSGRKKKKPEEKAADSEVEKNPEAMRLRFLPSPENNDITVLPDIHFHELPPLRPLESLETEQKLFPSETGDFEADSAVDNSEVSEGFLEEIVEEEIEDVFDNIFDDGAEDIIEEELEEILELEEIPGDEDSLDTGSYISGSGVDEDDESDDLDEQDEDDDTNEESSGIEGFPSAGAALAAEAAAIEAAAKEKKSIEERLASSAAPGNRSGADSPAAASGSSTADSFKSDLEKALTLAEEEAKAKSKAAAEKAEVLKQGGSRAQVPAWKKTAQKYSVPIEGILTAYPDGEYWVIDQATRDAAVILKNTLEEFKIQADVTGIRKGPVITMFEILPAPGVKLSKIVNLQDNIALRLAASSVRIVAPIPGKHAVGIEVPNKKRNIVSFREMIEGELRKEGKKAEIPVILGKDITGEAQTFDLVSTPHLLIAGSTGSGKSVCVNSIILSILYQKSPAEVRLILIDPKIVELKLYNDIPHLLTPVITEPKRAFQALQYCIYEMERRYALLDGLTVRDIRSYNRRIKERKIATEHLPYIVVIIDEFADLMATTGKELESTVARLAAMSRAVGIHLVLATQRPSINVITGLIKANIPSRIAFMVAGYMDSRIIIDRNGAEKLLGKGDLLYAGAGDSFPVRMQGAFVSEEEVERVVEYIKGLGEPDYIDEEIFFDDEDEVDPSLFSDGDDPLYEKALEIVMQQGKASASYIQRRLKIGYNRAARLVEEMEERGIVGPAQGSKPREVLRMM